MAERPRQTLTDYVTLAIGPALIMALVGSLIFFLVEVLYAGAYGPQMRWMLFFFVFGMVLIARIALTNAIAGRAGVYALVLGFLVWFGLLTYVTYPAESLVGPVRGVVNLALVILAWWCIQRLVRDCTQIDDKTEIESRGLLQAAGLEELDPRAEKRRKATEGSRGGRPAAEDEPEPRTWWERWQRYREERAKRRTPGVTVVWFSLAALPLFGLGQSLIPLAAVERRRYVFWLMAVYLGSALGLLLTTSFLGLRRYLNQRRLRMPRAMTAVWLAVGGGLVVLLLVLGALLPRPAAEYPWFDLKPAGSNEPDASRYAKDGDQAGKGEGRAGAGQGGKEEGGNARAKDGQDKDGAPGKKQNKNGKSGPAPSGEGAQDGATSEQASSPPAIEGASQLLRSMAVVLKWIVFALIALVVLLFVLRSGLRWLANFFQWARCLLEALRNFWASLFGGWTSAGTSTAAAEAEERKIPPRPFASFSNPFTDGNARGRTPRELVRYTFAALEAWARDRDLGRADGETPREFAERVGAEVPAVEDAVRGLSDLFARAAYARDDLPNSSVDHLRIVWERLVETARVPAVLGETAG